MNRYKKGDIIEDHLLSSVYGAYNVNKETEFVKSFFGKDEVNTILEACGLSPLEDFNPIYEKNIMVGLSPMRADLLFELDNTIYYFEIMSQSNNGKWDNDHHKQMILKQTILSLDYDVYTFSVAFKEFEPAYIEQINNMENNFAIHLRFNDNGYFADVYGAEEKKREVSIASKARNDIGIKWLEIASSKMGFKNRKETICNNRYIYIGKGYSGSKGIEWSLNNNNGTIGIKLCGSDLYKYNTNIEDVINHLKSNVSGFEYIKSRDTNILFKFNTEDYSDVNVEFLKKVTETYASYIGLNDLLK